MNNIIALRYSEVWIWFNEQSRLKCSYMIFSLLCFGRHNKVSCYSECIIFLKQCYLECKQITTEGQIGHG